MKNAYHIEKFLLRIKNFNELNLMIKSNEFSKLFPRGIKLTQVDSIRDTLKVIDINGVSDGTITVVKSNLPFDIL